MNCTDVSDCVDKDNKLPSDRCDERRYKLYCTISSLYCQSRQDTGTETKVPFDIKFNREAILPHKHTV
jgi:hypothetical protein